MMKYLGFAAAWIIVVMLLGVLLLGGLDGFTSARAEQIAAEGRARADYVEAEGRARAMVIDAQGQSRLDSAQAASVTSTAALPWLVIGLAIPSLALVAVAIWRRPEAAAPSPAPAVPQLETRIIFLPLPADAVPTSRRQGWEFLSGLLNSAASPALPAG